MSSLTTLEKRVLEDLLGMAGGYVLDFSNNSFAQLFRDTIDIDIYHDKYAVCGDSKARRLRVFWELEADLLVGKLLTTVLDVWKYENDKKGNIVANKEYLEARKIANRLLGKSVEERDAATEFLTRDLGDVDITNLKIDSSLVSVLNHRIKEAKICLKNDLSLSVIFLCGSILEGLLLAVATQNPKQFNQSAHSPKDDGEKVKPFHLWTLSDFIDVACDTGVLGLDVKKFSHSLREFRNYIHPYQQMVSKFNPDPHTAKICMQVLKAAISDLSEK